MPKSPVEKSAGKRAGAKKSSSSKSPSVSSTANSALEAQATALVAEIMARRQAAQKLRSAALAKRKTSTLIRTEVTHRLAAAAAAPIAATGALTTAGYLVALGDSWFAYPIHNVLTKLEDHFAYNVESSAINGQPIETMVSHVGQLDKFARLIDKIKSVGARPRAILVSGGGDDVAGKEFGMLINSCDLSDAGWNQQVLTGVIDGRVATACRKLFLAVNKVCQADFGTPLPILIHGYDYPVPDGRGFVGGWGPFPGPWLKPGFDQKLFTDRQQNITMMAELIDRFNTMLQTLVKDFPDVHYIDLRGTLPNGPDYKQHWANELHPTSGLFQSQDGFLAVATKFEAVLSTLPPAT